MLETRIARFPRAYHALRVSLHPSLRDFSISASRTNARPSRAVIGQTKIPVDEDGIPLEAPYSINGFLSDLPAPRISDEQFLHLHKLAALIPPSPGTQEFATKKQALEDMVRLVEGVRPDVKDGKTQSLDRIPDGRIWPEAEGIQLDWQKIVQPARSAHNTEDLASEGKHKDKGKGLLNLASKQVAGYYVVKKRQAADVE